MPRCCPWSEKKKQRRDFLRTFVTAKPFTKPFWADAFSAVAFPGGISTTESRWRDLQRLSEHGPTRTTRAVSLRNVTATTSSSGAEHPNRTTALEETAAEMHNQVSAGLIRSGASVR
jgi:hypothetical protein